MTSVFQTNIKTFQNMAVKDQQKKVGFLKAFTGTIVDVTASGCFVESFVIEEEDTVVTKEPFKIFASNKLISSNKTHDTYKVGRQVKFFIMVDSEGHYWPAQLKFL